MKCKHPLLAYWLPGNFTKNGKKKIEWFPDGFYPSGSKDGRLYEQIEIPCGKCMACRINYARNWGIRAVCESRDHEENYFLTVTYDNKHIKDKEGNIGIENLKYFPTVDMDEISSFIKRLRADQEYRNIDEKLKFLACTEYGDREQRPHGHILLFGYHHPLTMSDGSPAMVFWKVSDSGFPIYRSLYLEKKWEKGNVFVGEVSKDSAQYVAKYSIKNVRKLHEWCDEVNVERPSIRMSRRPGIGNAYFERNKIKLLEDGCMYIDGVEYPLPDCWLSAGENNEESMYEAMSDALDSLNKKLASYEQRRVQTDKSIEEEIYENRRRPAPEIILPRKGV